MVGAWRELRALAEGDPLAPEGGSGGGRGSDGPRADVHQGFDRVRFTEKMVRAGFRDVRVASAAEVTKPTAGGTRVFPVFLAIGEKGA